MLSKQRQDTWNRYMTKVTGRKYANRDVAQKAYMKLCAEDKLQGKHLLDYWYPTKSRKAKSAREDTKREQPEAREQQVTPVAEHKTIAAISPETEEDYIDVDAQFFKFEDDVTIRVADVGGKEWFVARDICLALGLDNSRQTLTRLDEDQKGVITVATKGGAQKVSIINRSGVYELVFASRKPEAKRFRRWLTDEVIPALEKGKWTRATRGKKRIEPMMHHLEVTRYENGLPSTSLVLYGPRREGDLIELAKKDIFGHMVAREDDSSYVPTDYIHQGTSCSQLFAVDPGAPAGHYPAAVLFKKLLSKRVADEVRLLTALATNMLAISRENATGAVNIYGKAYGVSPSGAAVIIDHAHYDVETVWGVFLTALYQTYHQGWPYLELVALTVLGQHARDSFKRRTLLPVGDPSYVPIPKLFLQAEAALRLRGAVL